MHTFIAFIVLCHLQTMENKIQIVVVKNKWNFTIIVTTDINCNTCKARVRVQAPKLFMFLCVHSLLFCPLYCKACVWHIAVGRGTYRRKSVCGIVLHFMSSAAELHTCNLCGEFSPAHLHWLSYRRRIIAMKSWRLNDVCEVVVADWHMRNYYAEL